MKWNVRTHNKSLFDFLSYMCVIDSWNPIPFRDYLAEILWTIHLNLILLSIKTSHWISLIQTAMAFRFYFHQHECVPMILLVDGNISTSIELLLVTATSAVLSGLGIKAPGVACQRWILLFDEFGSVYIYLRQVNQLTCMVLPLNHTLRTCEVLGQFEEQRDVSFVLVFHFISGLSIGLFQEVTIQALFCGRLRDIIVWAQTEFHPAIVILGQVHFHLHQAVLRVVPHNGACGKLPSSLMASGSLVRVPTNSTLVSILDLILKKIMVDSRKSWISRILGYLISLRKCPSFFCMCGRNFGGIRIWDVLMFLL